MAVFSLTDVLQGAYIELGQLEAGKATGGSTTTLIDTNRDANEADDVWNEGVAFITESTDNAIPEGQFSKITDYVGGGTSTFTLRDTITAPEAGDRYGLASDFYPIDTMIELLNASLRRLGDIEIPDVATITTAASQSEYTYPLVAKRTAPIKVEIQLITNDANDNQWYELPKGVWRYDAAAPGTTGILYLPKWLPVSRTIRFWHRDRHPRVSAYNDSIVESLNPDTIVKMLTLTALQWQNRRLSGGDEFLVNMQNDLAQEVAVAKAENLDQRSSMPPELMIFGGTRGAGPNMPPVVPFP